MNALFGREPAREEREISTMLAHAWITRKRLWLDRDLARIESGADMKPLRMLRERNKSMNMVPGPERSVKNFRHRNDHARRGAPSIAGPRNTAPRHLAHTVHTGTLLAKQHPVETQVPEVVKRVHDPDTRTSRRVHDRRGGGSQRIVDMHDVRLELA